MKAPDFQKCTLESALQYVKNAHPDDIESNIANMTIEQISNVIININEKNDDKWREKTKAIILGLNKRPQLEAAGKTISVKQTLELINNILQIEDKHHWKLSPLLVGLPHETFSEIILQATDNQLHIFQHEGVTEPVQHHLTTLTHEMTRIIEKMELEIDTSDMEIENIDPSNLGRDDVFEYIHKIDTFGSTFQRLFFQTNQALSIAWNTKRLDVIENLNKIKDSCQKYSIYGLGCPRSPNAVATGLYAKLENKLFLIFGDPENPSDFEALNDDEPAIEALIKLSVWYLKDYWKIGLLPSVKNISELDVDMEKHSESERAKHREKLFAEAKNNLKALGLSTLNDLKDNYIFSRLTLEEYINLHR